MTGHRQDLVEAVLVLDEAITRSEAISATPEVAVSDEEMETFPSVATTAQARHTL